MSIWKIFIIFGIVSRWAEKAMADNKITLEESVDLANQLSKILGISTTIELPGLPKPIEDESSEKAIEDESDVRHKTPE